MPSGALQRIDFRGRHCLFLARHGQPHRIPPHRINYRANLWALREAGVRRVIAINSVGGIAAALTAGAVAVPDQIVDYTSGREHTFYDGIERAGVDLSPLEHVDFTHPYSAELRRALRNAAELAGVEVIDGGVYGATQGPRLESIGEIRRMANDGCDLVGMTGMPEAGLARELGLDYAALCLVVNPAAGIGEGEITMDDINRVIASGMGRVRALLGELLAALL
jgi:5'-methylthioinosine phosphorylase